MRRWVALVASLGLVGCIVTGCAATHCRPRRAATTVLSEELHQTRCGVAYHWPAESFPIRIRLSPDLPEEYVDGVEEARLVWNSLVGMEFLVIDYDLVSRADDGSAEGTIYFREAALGITRDSLRTYGEARTLVPVDATGEIHHSVIELDEDLPSHVIVGVVIHEVGHALGLSHDAGDPRSIMFYAVWEPALQRVSPRDVRVVQEQIGEQALSAVAQPTLDYYAPWLILMEPPAKMRRIRLPYSPAD